MTAKEHLEKVRQMNIYLKALEHEYFDLRQRAMSLSAMDYSRDKVQTSEHSDLSNTIAKVVDKADEIMNECNNLQSMRKEVKSIIYGIPNYTIRTILIERYINCKSWNKVAEDVGYSWSQVHRYHRVGLKEYGKLYNMTHNGIEWHTLDVV